MLRRRRHSLQARQSALLISSELVTNALRHGEGQIELRVKLLEDRLRIEVVDEGEGGAPAVCEEASDRGGWGLRIVDQLALGWGVREGATHVWADLALA